jgi:hypothetical protein
MNARNWQRKIACARSNTIQFADATRKRTEIRVKLSAMELPSIQKDRAAKMTLENSSVYKLLYQQLIIFPSINSTRLNRVRDGKGVEGMINAKRI